MSSLCGSVSAVLLGAMSYLPWDSFVEVWPTWVFGDLTAFLCFTPCILHFYNLLHSEVLQACRHGFQKHSRNLKHAHSAERFTLKDLDRNGSPHRNGLHCDACECEGFERSQVGAFMNEDGSTYETVQTGRWDPGSTSPFPRGRWGPGSTSPCYYGRSSGEQRIRSKSEPGNTSPIDFPRRSVDEGSVLNSECRLTQNQCEPATHETCGLCGLFCYRKVRPSLEASCHSSRLPSYQASPLVGPAQQMYMDKAAFPRELDNHVAIDIAKLHRDLDDDSYLEQSVDWSLIKQCLSKVGEFFLLCGFTISLSLVIFFNLGVSNTNFMQRLSYLLFPVVIWGAFRSNRSGLPLSILLVAIIASAGTAKHKGPLYRLNDNHSLLQVFAQLLLL